jgi:hypothetical protein
LTIKYGYDELRNGGMNPATATQNRLKPVDRASGNLIHQVLCNSGGFESAELDYFVNLRESALLSIARIWI